mmetsp:Transcript_10736/g.14608  ORF Transcript_10736/g.14608 Transcript_10736/m.14608 type:complete len:398 (-) Transcript_10736:111-1304(-)|eukprot:CAMPEP_0196574750 /NCGR_PEP_ID=MMETSP1081-20130531/4397_1 /TAXON_ID=36882 /ORGANISM="Pyramimonas amylifera, Strain CCMP720" /LENGTH=397 /DNA_ID=CAMNT_0041892859 /DNA_START=103 /DNA_END=1296 /DNA_ORIENTATION=-
MEGSDGPPFAAGKTNLWTKIIDHNKAAAKQPGGDQGRPDANLYFVGSRSSGKSTMLNRFLYPDKTDIPKTTEGMEYTYARKSASNNIERKDIAHIWEIAGSESLYEEVTNSENLFLGMRQIATSVVCIVVDLSKPGEVLTNLEFWLNKIKLKAGATYEKLERRGSKLPDQLKARSKKMFGLKHDDKDSIVHTGISLVIVATKYDTFRDHDAEVRKIMGRTLRYYAHTNGAALIYMGGVGPNKSVVVKDAPEYKALLNNLRTLLHHLVFTGPDQKLASKLNLEIDHMKPLIVPAGSDHLKDIGRPRGGGETTGDAAIGEWRAVFQKLFPSESKDKEKEEWSIDQEQYAEQVVDNVVAQKNAEVQAYKKQVASQSAAARQQAAARASQQLQKKASMKKT